MNTGNTHTVAKCTKFYNTDAVAMATTKATAGTTESIEMARTIAENETTYVDDGVCHAHTSSASCAS